MDQQPDDPGDEIGLGPAEPAQHNRRRKTSFEWVTAAGSAAGALAAIGVVVSFALDQLPFAKAQETSDRFVAVEQRVDVVEAKIGSIERSGLENLELQLVNRVDRIDDALTRLSPGSPEHAEKRADRNEVQQRLDQVRIELRRARSAPP